MSGDVHPTEDYQGETHILKARLIMLIRHGEKPDGEFQGVNELGKGGKDDLIVRGWQRAGALVHRFAPLDGSAVDSRLARPDHIVAMSADQRAPGENDKSDREVETAGPLAEALGLHLDRRFGKGTEDKAALAITGQDGAVLVVWDHNKLLDLARRITADPLPAEWPGTRFDLIWVFRLRADGSGYSFEQVPQLLLAGDTADVLPIE